MYTCDIFLNTGYNPVNVPDSYALLGEADIHKSAIDAIQNRVLSAVNIRVSNFEEIRDADYCKIGDFCYFVTGIIMQSVDVASLELVPDYITSAGLDNLIFLDGITERHHTADDEFGKYSQDDELLIANQPLELIMADRLYDKEETDTINTFIDTTVNIGYMGSDVAKNAITYKDPTTELEVTVPHLTPLLNLYTEYRLGENQLNWITIEGLGTFDAKNTNVKNGVQYCRDIAAETAITAQYQAESKFIVPVGEPNEYGLYGVIAGNLDQKPVTGIEFEYAEVKNKRVLYGSLNKIGLLTASGERAEFDPETIYNGNNELSVVLRADPRAQGKPYYRFRYYLGTDGFTNSKDFWNNCVEGAQWKEVPLIFSTASGSAISRKLIDKHMEARKTTHEFNGMMMSTNNLFGSIDAMAGLALNNMGPANFNNRQVSYPNAITGQNGFQNMNMNVPVNNTMSNFSGIGGLLGNAVTAVARGNQLDYAYEYAAGKELYQYALGQNIVVPTVEFPITPSTIRDFLGNGVQVYRYRPSEKDLKRMDKVLTMYGYKDTEILSKDLFFNRKYFNYIKAYGISIGGDLPRWFKEGITAQLSAGLRIWHTKPNISYYNNNPINIAIETKEGK